MNWYLKVLKQYADFSGRARRQEYWMYTLFNVLIIIVIGFLSTTIASTTGFKDLTSILIGLYILAVFLPSLAVTVRRLHDQNKSGWYILVRFIPLIGSLWLLILLSTEGTVGSNQYGVDPKSPETEIDDIGVLEA